MGESPKEKEARGRQASIEGFANEKIICGLLMKKYGNVSMVDLPLSSYDMTLVNKLKDGSEDIIRIQSKTATKSVPFTGGGRGGVERIQISGIKTYVQSPKRSDCVVGIHFEDGEPVLYFVPTFLIAELKSRKGEQAKSISINKIKPLKNNYEILEKCKDRDFVIKKAKEYEILPKFHNSVLL
jgi:hypothetical protein